MFRKYINDEHTKATHEFHVWAETNLQRVTHTPPLMIAGMPADADYRVFYILAGMSSRPCDFTKLFQRIEANHAQCLAEQGSYQGDARFVTFMVGWQEVYIRGYLAALKWAQKHYPLLTKEPELATKRTYSKHNENAPSGISPLARTPR